jgi:zinc transporter
MSELSNTFEGLVCAYILDGQGGGRRIEWADVNNSGEGDGLLWVHLDFTQPGACEWIQNESGVHKHIVDALIADDSRPRSIRFEQGVLSVLRGVNTNPDSDVEDMVSIRIWLEDNRIITTRRRQLRSIKDLEQMLENGNGPTDSGSFLADLSERLVGRISQVVEQIDEDIEANESQLQQSALASMRGKFATLRRRTAHLRRYLAPQRDALFGASRMQGSVISDQASMSLHEHANSVTLFIEELDLARERTMVAQEEILTLLAHEQNSKIFLLSIVAAVFLPLSFLTGLMGMNVAGLPGTENEASFNIIVIIMLALAVGILFLFRIKKWL